MFKPLQGASGTLVQPLGSADNIMYVDPQLIAYVYAGLGAGDGNHTFLLIEQAGIAEAVKVMDFGPYALIVERGKDGSQPRNFIPGATIRYILTTEAVQGIVYDYVTSLGLDAVTTFDINAPHVVTKLGNQVTLDIKSPNISSPDGSIDVTGTGLDIGVSIQRGAFGCCD